VKLIAEISVSDPYIFKLLASVEVAKVGVLVAPVQIISLQTAVEISTVTVCPPAENELASK